MSRISKSGTTPMESNSSAKDERSNDELAGDSNLHWMLQMLQTIEVGLFVINRQTQIELWNSFMENHSGVRVANAKQRNLFELFPDLPKSWLERKINAVFKLKSRAYSTWEQRPHIFRFKAVRPLTSQAPWMYQNLTLTPLIGPDGEVSHVCVLIYDVTDIATNRLHLERANQQLAKLSQTDSLTSLANRGHWESCMQNEFARVRRYQGMASLILLDIDHFKAINDTYGHQAGDEVLRQVAAIIRESLRDTDKPGRYGGEEFAVLLPNTDAENALILAERLRNAVASHDFNCEQNHLKLTVSLGVAQLDDAMPDYLKWVEAADHALYQSKHAGRNQTSLHRPK